MLKRKYGWLLIALCPMLFASTGMVKAFREWGGGDPVALENVRMTPPSRVTVLTSWRVTIDSGILEGDLSGGVLSFKGIPYAAPPVNNYRWRAPQPVTRWSGVREAKSFGSDCMQEPDPGDSAPIRTIPNEDCLVINIWRPAPVSPRDRLPVLFWIHGGGYVSGGSSPAVYDGSNFARHEIVFVSFNYRLGRFGFFAHPALIKAKEGPVGNFAYMDQIAALRWVQRNIARFGGDSNAVTVMGESAGGFSVMALLTSTKAQNLFQRAIVMSGAERTIALGGRRLTDGTPTDPSANMIGTHFAESVGIAGDGPRALQALRALPASTVVSNLETIPGALPTYAGGPIIDNDIVVGQPQEILRRGQAVRVPILIGSDTQDLAATVPQLPENPLSYFGANVDKAAPLYNPEGKLQIDEVRLALGRDIAMHEPARFVAKEMIQAGVPAWLYRFGYVAESVRPKMTGAIHASELPFLFGTLDARYGAAITEKDRVASEDFSRYFINFAKSGDPNGSGLPAWPKFDPVGSELMAFTMDYGPIAQPDPRKDRLDLVEHAADTFGEGDK